MGRLLSTGISTNFGDKCGHPTTPNARKPAQPRGNGLPAFSFFAPARVRVTGCILDAASWGPTRSLRGEPLAESPLKLLFGVTAIDAKLQPKVNGQDFGAEIDSFLLCSAIR